MTEIDYVKSQALHDRQERAKAIVELRAVEAKNLAMSREVMRLRLRVAELEAA